MKKRIGFVSNSSSSSFVINKKDLSMKQIKKIHNHIEEAKKMSDPNKTPKGYEFQYGWSDEWTINEGEEIIAGYTSMDNFEMNKFLADIGIDEKDIFWKD